VLLSYCLSSPVQSSILVVGDAQSAKFVFAKGGSQVVDNETGLLLITETFLDILDRGGSMGFETRLHWKPREDLTEVDALSKTVDRHDFGLRPEALKFAHKAFGSWDVRFITCLFVLDVWPHGAAGCVRPQRVTDEEGYSTH